MAPVPPVAVAAELALAVAYGSRLYRTVLTRARPGPGEAPLHLAGPS